MPFALAANSDYPDRKMAGGNILPAIYVFYMFDDRAITQSDSRRHPIDDRIANLIADNIVEQIVQAAIDQLKRFVVRTH